MREDNLMDRDWRVKTQEFLTQLTNVGVFLRENSQPMQTWELRNSGICTSGLMHSDHQRVLNIGSKIG